MEMKRRGAARVLGVDFDEDYLAQARFAAEVEGPRHRVPPDSASTTSARSGSVSTSSSSSACSTTFAIPLLALDLIHEHVAGDMLVFQSMQRGSNEILPLAPDYEFWEQRHLRRSRLPEAAFHRAQLLARQHQLVGAEPRLLGGDAARRRVPHRGQPGGRNLHLPPRRAAGPALRRGLSRRKGAGHDRSGDDLERAQQQVALGFRERPGLGRCSPR